MTMANAFSGAVPDSLDPQDAALIERRAKVLGPAYRLFYEEPLHLVSGKGIWLQDAQGRSFLDAYNNVASVGHCHPRVVEAIAQQSMKLNTHTRYLHEDIVSYAERLLAKLPSALGHVMFTCTGSEANDLALRIARGATGRQGLIVTSFAYHGVTEAVAQGSPALGSYVRRGAHVRHVPAPDTLRIPEAEQGARLRADIVAAIASMRAEGIEPAAFLVDSLFASDGIYPGSTDFLRPAVELVQAEGALYIADEVQPGFTRTGTHFWGFERHGLSPDIVTMGKPMGNGYPVAGMAVRPEYVAEFGAKSRYFNTFGGNPVAVAAAMAVLDVIEEEGLAAQAVQIGTRLKGGIAAITAGWQRIADVRGAGMFLAVECVTDPASLTPDAAVATALVNELRREHVLISACGPSGNILKIRPPLVMTVEEADIFLERFGLVAQRVRARLG